MADDAAATSADAAAGPVYAAVTQKLTAAFAPLAHLQVLNESSAHNVAPGSETHFKVVVVSEAFAAAPPLERHRRVNAALADELAGPIHALSIVAKTPEQWARSADSGCNASVVDVVAFSLCHFMHQALMKRSKAGFYHWVKLPPEYDPEASVHG